MIKLIFFNHHLVYDDEGRDIDGYNSAGYNSSGFDIANNYNEAYDENVTPS